MTRQELQALIDRVIGKKGIMRSSAWWVRKLFNKVLEYVESYTKNAVANAKVKSDTEMSDESENPAQNKVIKAYVDDAVSKKADTSYVDDAVSKKADTSYVDDAVSKKADIDELHAGLNRLTDIIFENEEVVAYSLSDLKRDLAKIEKRIDLLEAK